jgi:hypothetical protein
MAKPPHAGSEIRACFRYFKGLAEEPGDRYQTLINRGE